jgi:glucoamylase
VAACYLRETADAWNEHIERWIYASDTQLARQLGVGGYYVRIAQPEQPEAASPYHGFVPIKNRPPDQTTGEGQMVSPDALALVRFGLRAADDPRMIDTVRVIDALLKVTAPTGPVWRRYNGDRYGEHNDGAPFDGAGIGRAWPLLTGERAHYELAAGRSDEAQRLMRAMASFANKGGMIPEQVWDGPDLPDRELFFGRPSGSAMPLVWAHAEYVKLRRSLREGRVFDLPPQTVQRYLVEKTTSPHTIWRFNHKSRTMREGKALRLEVLAPARVRWSTDRWHTVEEADTRDTTPGVFLADIPTEHLTGDATVDFTFYWRESQRWEGTVFSVSVE